MTTASTIPAVLAAAADRFGDHTAIVDGTATLTFAELDAAVQHAARALVATDVEPGERVAIWAPNKLEWAIAALAIYSAGAVLVPLNTRYKGHEAAYILDRARVRVLFTVADFLGVDYPALLRDAPSVPSLRETIALEGDTWPDFLARAAAVDDAAVAARADKLTADDVSDVLFTSGTTGRPKGAMLTHGASVQAFRAWSEVIGLRSDDRYLIVNPFFHAFGLKAGILACLLRGTLMLPQPVFDVDAVIQRIHDERVTMLPGPPTIYQSLLDHPRRGELDLSSLRLAVTGAARVPVELIRRMRSELGFETVVTGYGLTEATGIATMCRHDDDPQTIATTSGRAIPGVEVQAVGSDGTPVATGEPGEIVIRGYNVMRGYLDDPEATADAIDADGWLHTGDIGVQDERGNVRITDRTKDMFIVGGFNAYPAEIENMLSEHPAISQVAVVGVPDERLGEVGHAFVVVRPGCTLDAAELIAWSKERMANYKAPRYVTVVDALPLNASGKVLKFELRARAAGDTLA